MQKIFISLAVLVLLSAPNVYSGDVKPDEKLGEFQVLYPDLSKATGHTGADSPDKTFRIQFSMNGKGLVAKAGEVYKVMSGDNGCLIVSGPQYETKPVCNIQIKAKQRTVVNLSAFSLSWNIEVAKVDLGPVLYFKVGPFNNTPMIGSFSIDEQKRLFLVPAGNYVVSFENVLPFAQVTRDIQMIAGNYKDVDLSLPDLRSTIRVIHNDLPRTFPAIPTNHINLLHRGKVSLMAYKNAFFHYSAWEANPFQLFRFEGGNERFYNNVRSALGVRPLETQQTFRVFHLNSTIEDEHYELVVNNIPLLIDLKASQETQVTIENINVYNYVSTIKGKYKAYRMIPQENGTVARKQMEIPSKNAFNVSTMTLPTETSLDLPRGWIYEFDFYAVDSLGQERLEDTKSLDLRN